MTRRLIMWNLVTLEGFFEGAKKWDLDWHEYVWGAGGERKRMKLRETRPLKSGGVILFCEPDRR